MAFLSPKPVLTEMIISTIPNVMASVAAKITGPIIEPLVFRAFCIFRAMYKGTFKVKIVVAKNRIIAALASVLLLVATGAPVQAQITNGIDRDASYLPTLKGKRVAVVCNQTSIRANGEHLVDFLLDKKVDVKKVFAPEHGFRGTASAGEELEDGKDKRTGLPIISLYGKNKKPTAEMLADLDIVIFDIQDVGARFYTYISTMSLVMEACADAGVEVYVFDRPNPNGNYVDGPVLQAGFESFVGFHPVPVVHGMTVGEYAEMVNGEGWLESKDSCKLWVVAMTGYDHNMSYSLPVAPSPNLPNDLAIRLYPSLCFFEGTTVAVGRGTDQPFQQIGAPWLSSAFPEYSFVPRPNTGAKDPKYNGEVCYGVNLSNFAASFMPTYRQIYIYWLIEAYNLCPEKDQFFNSYFEKLAGTDNLEKQIKAGMSEDEIRKSWEKDLLGFKLIRQKYLLYPDFE